MGSDYFENFMNAYRVAGQEIKNIIDSELIPICIKKLVDAGQIDHSHYLEVLKLYSLLILGAIDENTMVEEMKKLGIPESRVVFYSLQICREKTPLTFVNYDDLGDLSADIAEAEAVLNTAPPTANQNIQNENRPQPENIYSSTQSVLLNEHKQRGATNN